MYIFRINIISHEARIINKRTREGIVRYVLPTDVEQCGRKVYCGHLHSVVDAPQRSAECVAQPREPTARCRVRFKHVEWEPIRQCNIRRVQIRCDDAQRRLVRKVCADQVLRIVYCKV